MKFWLNVLALLLAAEAGVAQACPELSSSMSDVLSFSTLRDRNFPVVVARPISIQIRDDGGHRAEVGTYEIKEVIHGCLTARTKVLVEAKCDYILTVPDPKQPSDDRLTCMKMDKSVLSGFTWGGRVLLPQVLLVLTPVAEEKRAAPWRELEAHLEDWCDADVGYVPGLKRIIARMKKWAAGHPARCAR